MTDKFFDTGILCENNNVFAKTSEEWLSYNIQLMECSQNIDLCEKYYHESKGWLFRVYAQADKKLLDENIKALQNRYRDIRSKLGSQLSNSELNSLKKTIEDGLTRDFDFTGNCKTLLQTLPLWFDEQNNWWLFSKNTWHIVDEINILAAMNDAIKVNSLLNNQAYTPFFRALKIEARKNAPTILGKEWVQFKDEIFNYKTCEKKLLTKDFFITNASPIKLGVDAETPIIDSLLLSWVGKDRVETLLDVMCYCFIREYPIQRIVALLGSGGNGKGSFIRLLTRLVGVDNMSSSSLDRISTNRFESSNLYNKLICDISETDVKQLKSTEFLKRLCGGDYISAEFKGKNSFKFYNYSKLIISSNSLPETPDKTPGYYRRFLAIDFIGHFRDGHEIINDVSDEELSNFAFKLMKRLPALLERGFFLNEPETVDERQRVYEEKSNPVKTFINEFFSFNPDFVLPKWRFSEALNPFLRERGYRELTSFEVNSQLRKQGFELVKRKLGKDGNPIWCVSGLDFKENCTKPGMGLEKFVEVEMK